ncbi:hypothetical protein Hdeb2414_s0612g00923931 [Helianthus debilis subsp. tardiflorus]
MHGNIVLGGLIIRAKKIHSHIQICINHTFFYQIWKLSCLMLIGCKRIHCKSKNKGIDFYFPIPFSTFKIYSLWSSRIRIRSCVLESISTLLSIYYGFAPNEILGVSIREHVFNPNPSVTRKIL